MVSQPCVLEPSVYFLAVESQARYSVYLFVAEACLTFHRAWEGKAHVCGAACSHARQSWQAASLMPRKAVAPGTAGGNAAPARLGLGILATACCLYCAFLCCGSPAFEVLTTARLCTVPAVLVEMPRGSDLAADQLRGETSSVGQNEQSRCM